MSEDEAADRVKQLKELFPDYTAQKGYYLRGVFLKSDIRTVDAAIERYAQSNPSLVIARLVDQIRDSTPPRCEAVHDVRRWKREKAAESQQIEQVLAALPPDRLCELHAEILAGMDESVRRLYQRFPITHDTIRSLIFQQLRRGSSAASV